MDQTFFAQILDLFAPEGVWAILSLMLIFYILWRQEKRDEQLDEREKERDSRDMKYQDSLSKLADAYEKMEKILKKNQD